MSWELRYSRAAVRRLRKLDSNVRAVVLSWMSRNIDGCEDARAHGKPLAGDLSGSWRYRVGDYRVLCGLRDDSLVVLTIEIAHRRSVHRRG